MGAMLLFVLARLAPAEGRPRRRGDRRGPARARRSRRAAKSAWFTLPVMAVWEVSWILLLLRFGLLAAIVGLFAHQLLVSFPLTADLSSWTAGPTLVALPFVAILGGAGPAQRPRRHRPPALPGG